MKIVFSIGGSILAPDSVDAEYVRKTAALLRQLSAENEVAAVVGGGKPARRAIKAAREDGATWAMCDWVGIKATRENALALVRELGDDANSEIPTSIAQAASFFGEKILVMGGTEPGHSTDAVATLIADWVGADVFINASNVASVYDKNPSVFPDAKPLKQVSIDELTDILSTEGSKAGEYPLLDHVALSIIRRSCIRTLFVDGRDIDNMREAALGSDFNGTTVTF